MTYSYQPHTTSSGVLTYSFSFAGDDPGYISVNDVYVETRESGQPEWVQLDSAYWDLTGSNQITLLQPIAAPADGTNNLRIRRIVPKEVPYATFPRGAMLDMLNLNRSFIQLLQALQEVLDGFLPEGFAFQQNINMNGHKLVNLAPGTDPGDSVNWDQWNNHEGRIDGLEDGFADDTPLRTIPWAYVAVGGELVLDPPYNFTSALLYINGLFQNKNLDAFSLSDNKITLAEPLIAGDEVYLLIGSNAAAPDDYVTQVDLVSAINQAGDDANAYTDSQIEIATEPFALKGANSDITSITGLTTPLAIGQGGLGAQTPAGGRTNLGLGGSATLNVGSVAGTVAAGDDSRIVGSLQKASNLSDLASASTSRSNLGLGNSATLNTGTAAGTVLAGNATGRLLSVQKITVTGTYTPTPGMAYCIMDIVGGSGAGGGCPATAVAQAAAGAGGNSGAYLRMLFTAAQIGASQAVTIGAAGAAVSGAAGGNGTATTIGALVSCPGGLGGGTTGAVATIAGGTFVFPSAKSQPTITTGTMLQLGWTLSGEYGIATTTTIVGGAGADSFMGSGAAHSVIAAGNNAPGSSGGGGGGASSGASSAARAGGNGSVGVVVIYEYS